MSEGDGKAARKKSPRILAITTDCCTGCAGSPACIEYCPIEACMFWVPDEDHPPFGRIEVDPYLCIGCQKCISKGPDGAFLDGCPWDAIEMVPTDDWEAVHGITLPDLPPLRLTLNLLLNIFRSCIRAALDRFRRQGRLLLDIGPMLSRLLRITFNCWQIFRLPIKANPRNASQILSSSEFIVSNGFARGDRVMPHGARILSNTPGQR